MITNMLFYRLKWTKILPFERIVVDAFDNIRDFAHDVGQFFFLKNNCLLLSENLLLLSTRELGFPLRTSIEKL